MIDEGSKASLADRIRHFVYQQYIEPARGAGRMDIMVRTGDIHAGMRLVGRMPAVCSALGRKFEAQYQIRACSHLMTWRIDGKSGVLAIQPGTDHASTQ